VTTVTFRREDGTVDVRQTQVVSARLEPEALEALYWDVIRRSTAGVVRFAGGALRVGGIWPAVLRFGPAAGGRRPITGGLFAARPGGCIGWESNGQEAAVYVEGFAPLLRGPLWRLESSVHAFVGRRFFARLAARR
jgi:hypothetical protein